MKMDYKGRWLFFPWQKADCSKELIHPDDFDRVERMGLAECLREEEGYLVLRTKDGTVVRVREEGVSAVLPSPDYLVGDTVQERARPEVEGVIADFLWHFKRQDYLYLLTVGGKKKSREYNADELTRI